MPADQFRPGSRSLLNGKPSIGSQCQTSVPARLVSVVTATNCGNPAASLVYDDFASRFGYRVSCRSCPALSGLQYVETVRTLEPARPPDAPLAVILVEIFMPRSDWTREAIRKIEADFNRSADTHLIPLDL